MFPVSERRNSKALRSLSLSINPIFPSSYLKKPLFSVLVCTIIGILLQCLFPDINDELLFLFCLILFVLSLLSYKKNRILTGVLLLSFFIVIGMFDTSYHLYPHGSQHIYHFSEQQGFLTGTVYQTEMKNNNAYQEILLDAHLFQIQNESYPTGGRILLKLFGDRFLCQVGDIINAHVYLEKPDVPGNYGEFNYRNYLAIKKVFITASVTTEEVERIDYNKGKTVFLLINGVKESINEKIEKLYPTPERGVIKAILTGDRTEIPEDWITIFQDAGVMHILAISGLHVGVLAMALYFIFSLIPIPDRGRKEVIRYLTIILILAGYAAMTGFRPSVSRAVLMFTIVLSAGCFHRPYHLYNNLCLAALILLWWQPLYLFDAGFLLSFIVTFFIIFLVPIMEKELSSQPSYFKTAISVSLSAWLGMAPLSAYFFYKISLIGILSNLFIIPLMSIILIVGLVSILFSFFLLPLSILLAAAVKIFLRVLVWTGQELASMPFAYQHIAQPEIYRILLYYLIVLIFFYALYFWPQYSAGEKKKTFWTLSTLVFLFCFLPMIFNSSELNVHFINVGQGDCIFIETPQKKHILIDGGGTPFNDFDVGVNTVIPYLRREGINQIDLMFLSHPDLDHLEGLLPVLQEMKVNLVIDSGIASREQPYATFRSFIQQDEKIGYHQARKGDIIRLSPDLEFFVLHPSQTIVNHAGNDFNHYSIVLKLRYKKIELLFTGDIEETVERELLSWNDFLKSDILKVAHHGSSTSTSELFLHQVQPEVAVISVGQNLFGHPHQEVLERLAEICTHVFRTDQNGTVVIRSDGERFKINTLR